MKLTIRTSLEETKDIQDTLKWKVENLEENNRPIEEGLADYFYLTDSNIQISLNQLSVLKLEIKQRESTLKAQQKKIKEEGAVFIVKMGEEQGIEKLNKLKGLLCSSVTVQEEITQEEAISEVFVLRKLTEDEESVLVTMGYATFEKKVTPQKVTPQTLRINKRKITKSEVIE